MNILIPDSWLREFLETNATPKQIKEYLSLCGPSVERIHNEGNETVYDVEVTSNRPDSMSILGVAREAAAILPRFGIAAKLKNDPYDLDTKASIKHYQTKGSKKLHIETDSILNPRWVSIVIDNVSVKPSPKWLQLKLKLTGIRPLNTIVDVTNYFMRAYGQPAHAFDYDEIKPKNDIPTMILRASKKGEKLTTLDGKNHTLPGGDIVIEDGSGRLIDLAGIMGGQNSSIKISTKTIVLFMQTYDPVNIRRTTMSLAHHTDAASLFEKGLDEELVLPTILNGIEMVKQVAQGVVVSKLYDIYPNPYKPYSVSVNREKVDAYVGTHLDDNNITDILSSLGFASSLTDKKITVGVPSFRRDIEIDVDIIEEIARMYGYHNVSATLPDSSPPVIQPDPILKWEEEIKIRLRDWGFTETYTYSMISDELMDIFELDKAKAYKISNPLSSEWVYMRPSLQPSVLQALKNNLRHSKDIRIFELSMIYQWVSGSIPNECSILIVVWSGNRFLEAKGLAETLFELFGIPFPQPDTKQQLKWKNPHLRLSLGTFGSVGILRDDIQHALGITTQLTVLDLNISKLVMHAKQYKTYIPIPKYPPVIEDMTYILIPRTQIGDVSSTIKSISELVDSVKLLTQFENTATFRIHYLNHMQPLTDEEVKQIRQKIKDTVESKFGAKLKG